MVSLLLKDPVLKTCLLCSILVWCPCFQRIPLSELVCYIKFLCGVLASKDPVFRTCLLYSSLVWCPCFIRIAFSEPVCSLAILVTATLVTPPPSALFSRSRSQNLSVILQKTPLSEPAIYIQHFCGVLASKGSRSQNLSVMFNSCPVSLLTKVPVLKTCLLYSTLIWGPCLQRIPFLEPVCRVQKYSNLVWCPFLQRIMFSEYVCCI